MVTFNVDSLDFVDDEEARFGAGDAFASRYSSSNSRLEIEDLTNATTAFLPQDVGTDLVGGKFAETVAEGKALADDGSVYDTIQGAVNNASSWVKVGPGTFDETVDITTAGLTVEGSGDRTAISGDNGISVSEVGNVTLSNFKVEDTDNTSVNTISAPNLTVDNITVIDSGGAGIQIDGDDVIISNCRIDGATAGINPTTGNSGNIIYNNVVKNISGDGTLPAYPESVIAYNTFENCGLKGMYVGRADMVVYANIIKNTEGDGIDVNDNDNVVVNNRLINTGGISDNGSGNLIQSNLIT